MWGIPGLITLDRRERAVWAWTPDSTLAGAAGRWEFSGRARIDAAETMCTKTGEEAGSVRSRLPNRLRWQERGLQPSNLIPCGTSRCSRCLWRYIRGDNVGRLSA